MQQVKRIAEGQTMCNQVAFEKKMRSSVHVQDAPRDMGFDVMAKAWAPHQAIGRQRQVLPDRNCWWRSLGYLAAGAPEPLAGHQAVRQERDSSSC